MIGREPFMEQKSKQLGGTKGSKVFTYSTWAVFFFKVYGLYTGMEAPRKAPQGYRLCEGRLRAPTRDTFAYAKRLREEFII